MAYRERAAMIPHAVVWQQASSGSGEVLPDGCMDLLWMDDTIVVAGPDTKAYAIAGDGNSYVGIRFAPGMLPPLIGVPAVALQNLRVPLADILGPGAVNRARDRFQSADRPDRVLEAYAAELAGDHDQDRRTAAVVTMIKAGRPMAEVAQRIGFSDRQLHRHGLQHFGYGPKMLARILRLQRAFRLAGHGSPAAAVASQAGYADQAHLIRECRSLTGRSFGDRIR